MTSYRVSKRVYSSFRCFIRSWSAFKDIVFLSRDALTMSEYLLQLAFGVVRTSRTRVSGGSVIIRRK